MDLLTLSTAIFFLILFQSSIGDEHLKLELVQVLFRHGERTPLEEDYAALHYTDPSVYEPLGLGQLTNNGKRQAYEVGQMLRSRYNGFLNETYSNRDIFAQSAELDRTQSSLQLVLAGLYSKSEWDANSKWNPIPYRCAPARLDVLFRQFKSKKFNQLLNDVIKLTTVEEKLATYSDLMKLVEGQEGVAVNTTFDLLRVMNTLLINKRMNILLPTWYSDNLMPRLRELAIYFGNCLTFTPEMKRIIGGPLVKTFVERMNLNGSNGNPRKMYLYSGSDYNVAAVARALDVDGFGYPDFSSTFVLEKLRDSDGQLYVRVLEWDAIAKKLINRKMKDCADFCPADEFLKLSLELIPSEKDMRYLLDDFVGQDILDLYIKDPLNWGDGKYNYFTSM